MAVTRYVSAAELQARLDATATWSASETTAHDSILLAVSRMVDDHCRRFFGQTASTARTFDGRNTGMLIVPDLVSVTSLKTDEDGDQSYERTWASTDYELYPYNAAAEYPARPYTEIHVSTATGSNDYTFPYGQRCIEVTGVWGWPEVPETVREVVILEAARMLEQSRAPSGIVANNALGTASIVPAMHPTSKRLLMPYINVSLRMGRAA